MMAAALHTFGRRYHMVENLIGANGVGAHVPASIRADHAAHSSAVKNARVIPVLRTTQAQAGKY